MILFNDLNDGQRKAVMSDRSRILCLAGAGTGKTKTLVSRVARLMDDGVDPYHICMLTFTRAAAMEQKERLVALIGDAGLNVFAGTFHSFAVSIIRQFAYRVGYRPNFTIYDEEDTFSLVQTIINELQYPIKAKDVIDAMEKNAVFNASIPKGDIKYIVDEFRFRCRQNNAMTFNQLIYYLKRLASDDGVQEILHRQYTYMFVDEFQDTDRNQMEIIESINPENLFVVGDDFQSIYGFRGSDVGIIMGLAESEEYEVVKLEENYRSTEEIVNTANALIKHNNQTEKELHAHRNGTAIELYEYSNPKDEDNGIATIIRELHGEGLSYSDIAVLSRTNNQIVDVANALYYKDIPHQIRTIQRNVLWRLDVKRIMDWCSVIINPSDDEAVYNVLNWPVERAGKLKMQSFEMYKLSHDCSLLTAVMVSNELNDFCDLYNRMSEYYGNHSEYSASDILKSIIEHTMVKEYFGGLGLNNRSEMMDELISYVEDWESRMTDAGESITPEAWLEWYNMRNVGTEALPEEKEDAVQLMTAHGSKGLEFEAVIVIGMNDGQFPLSRGDIEEERRLNYVALTRAKNRLILTRALQRLPWRGGHLEPTEPSRFLTEIEEYLPKKNYHTEGVDCPWL